MHFGMDWPSIGFDWNRARAFLAAAEEGSLSAAARALGVAQPTVGRQVDALEAELGVVLFERVGRGLELTPSGLELVEHVRAMAKAASQVALTASGRAESLDGTIRISATESVAAYLLPPALLELRARHPGIEVELVATPQASDLLRREADIAIRSFKPTEPDLIAKKVADMPVHLYGSRAYLERVGPFEGPEDLARAEIIGFERGDALMHSLNRHGLALTRDNFPIVTGEHLVQWGLARAGVGLCLMEATIGDAAPDMQRAAPWLEPMIIPIWLTTHRELHYSRRVRAVFDLLADALGAV